MRMPGEIEVFNRRLARTMSLARDAADPQSTQKILVTLAERPHPFPSRTRKLSSPAPKILRGQPFGKIGRRQDFCVFRGNAPGRPERVGRMPPPEVDLLPVVVCRSASTIP